MARLTEDERMGGLIYRSMVELDGEQARAWLEAEFEGKAEEIKEWAGSKRSVRKESAEEWYAAELKGTLIITKARFSGANDARYLREMRELAKGYSEALKELQRAEERKKGATISLASREVER